MHAMRTNYEYLMGTLHIIVCLSEFSFAQHNAMIDLCIYALFKDKFRCLDREDLFKKKKKKVRTTTLTNSINQQC